MRVQSDRGYVRERVRSTMFGKWLFEPSGAGWRSATGLGACNGSQRRRAAGRGQHLGAGRELSRREPAASWPSAKSPVRGSSGSGVSDGTLIGGGVGAAGGAVDRCCDHQLGGRRGRGRPARRRGGGIAGTAIDQQFDPARHRGDGAEGRRPARDRSPSPTTATSRWATASRSSTTATASPRSSATPATAATSCRPGWRDWPGARAPI